ncbi:MAG: hypothetical protein KC501_12140 [Myxococcales bacterium]|nr:hypothetical protein [Myxococcales bacterium]
MKTKTMMMWGVGAAALVGLGLAVVGTARADEGSGDNTKDDGPQKSEVRHGIRHEGCNHFELVDPDAIEAWGRDNAWRFSKWILSLDELRADPEPAIVDAMELLFPECPWPPPRTTTFQAERISWTEAMTMAKEAVATMDLAPAPGVSSNHTAGAFIGHMMSLALGGGRRR